MVLAWALVVAFMASQHVFWRDEVRHLSFAIQGDDVLEMLRGARGDAHPAVWPLLLRAAHELVPIPQVLPAVAFLVALAAVLLLAWRSPFAWTFVALFLLGRPALYEYSVMARNYGISMLLMFAFAALYSRHRDRGVVLGLVLFLLVNTNSHSVILAGAFMLYWLVDIFRDKAAWQAGAWRSFLLNALVVLVGVVLCVVTIYPTYNDAAVAAAQRARKGARGRAAAVHHLRAVHRPELLARAARAAVTLASALQLAAACAHVGPAVRQHAWA